MANNLTGLIPDIYEALDIISREQVGFTMAVSADNSAERAAQGQNVRVPIYGTESATDITPAVTPPDDGDNTTTYTDIVLNYAKRVPVRLNGTETRGLNSSIGATNYRAGRFAQGFRTLANLMESSLGAQYVNASRATGTEVQLLSVVTLAGLPMLCKFSQTTVRHLMIYAWSYHLQPLRICENLEF